MPGRELEPIGRSGPVLTEVAAEMSDIFARAGLGESAADIRRPAAVSALRPSRAGGGPTTLLLAAAAAGLAGLGAGAFVIRAPAPRAPTPAIQPGPVQPLPVQSAAGPSDPAIALAQAAPVASAAEPPPLRPSAAARPVRVPSARQTFRSGSDLPLAKAHVRRRDPQPVAQPAICERNAAGAGCRRAVIQADRHLRAVYENAVRRGVSHAVLVDYRDRWADLRERDTEDPVRLIESYGALAYDLGRESRYPPEGAERRRGSSGWRSVADAFRPLPLR